MNDNDPIKERVNKYFKIGQSYEWGRMAFADPWHDKNVFCPACLREIDDDELKPERCFCWS